MSDISKNISEAERSLTEKPMFATSAERIMILNENKELYYELPQPLRFSKILSILLGNVSTPVEGHDLILGRCVDRELNGSEEELFQSFIKFSEPLEKKALLSSGHCTYSWDMLVEEGLVGLRERVRSRLCHEPDEDKRIFLTAIYEIYGTLSEYMLRYADAAEACGLYDAAKNLRIGATERPSSFASALQLLWIITLIDCAYITKNPTLTLGRLDKILYPLYVSDVEKGAITRERAKEYITDYYCKHNLIMGRGEHQVGDAENSTTFDRICNFDAPQYLLLAGSDENGQPLVNELTELFAECIVPSFKNPVVVVRYVRGMNERYPDLWRTLTDKALASSSMMFYNDENVISAFLRIGLPIEDARKYSHFGCNWCSPGDNGAWMAGGPNSSRFDAYESEEEKAELTVPYKVIRTSCPHGWPEDLMVVLRTLADREDEGVTVDDVYRLFFERMSALIDRKLKYLSKELSVRRRRPSALLTFGDCFYRDSLKNAECVGAGAKYHFELQSFQMFGTVCDCIIAIDQLVMREKRFTLKELLTATEANFEGYEEIAALCRRAEKYGMDTPLSNEHARRLSHTASALTIEKSRPYLEKYGLFLVPCMQSDTWHLKMGEDYGATPDGRAAGTPFSQNTRPSNGACVNGITGMFNSMLNLPNDGLVSGALNLDVSPKQYEGEKGKALFSALLGTYFNNGGLHAQVSGADLEMLLDAKEHPEDHRDLRVRVTGYSGVFVDLPNRLQNDVIERMK